MMSDRSAYQPGLEEWFPQQIKSCVHCAAKFRSESKRPVCVQCRELEREHGQNIPFKLVMRRRRENKEAEKRAAAAPPAPAEAPPPLRKNRRAPRACATCGEDITWMHATARFCSPKCKGIKREAKAKARRLAVKPKSRKRCAVCRKDIRGMRGNRIYCSDKCQAVALRILRIAKRESWKNAGREGPRP